VKVPGASSCTAAGYADYTDATGGTAQGCRAAAESAGYDFSSYYSQLHAIPVQHSANGEYRYCVACENMIYQGNPTLLFFDRQSRAVNPNQCDQNGQQTKFHICKSVGTLPVVQESESTVATIKKENNRLKEVNKALRKALETLAN